MIKLIIKYTFLILFSLLLAFMLSFFVKNSIHLYNSHIYKNKKVSFLENNINSKDAPKFCFQSIQKLVNDNNFTLPEMPPIGTIPNSSVLFKEYLIKYDKYGFRNKNTVWNNKDHDYLVLGDSIVADTKVPDNFLFTNQFKNKKSVINAGCGGNGLLSSFYILKQLLEAEYKFTKILFFINLENDFTKDTLREVKIEKLFDEYDNSEEKNMFLNNRQYTSDYENLIKKSFRKEINNYSFLRNILETFSINSFINYFNKFKKLIFKDKKNDEIILADSTTKNKINFAHNHYQTDMYNLFLQFLEKISYTLQNKKTELIFILVPTYQEVKIYSKNKKSADDWEKYLNYKYIKNTLTSTIANYNIGIIDLYYFVYNKNEEFFNGHFSKKAQKKLSKYIQKSINSEDQIKYQKLLLYNSHYPSKNYFNYTVNFGKKLNQSEVNDWLKSISYFTKKNQINNYLLAAPLGYFFINQECSNILKLNKMTENKILNYSNGKFFYLLCRLDQSKSVKEDIKVIDNLIDKDIKYFFPIISKAINEKIGSINEK